MNVWQVAAMACRHCHDLERHILAKACLDSSKRINFNYQHVMSSRKLYFVLLFLGTLCVWQVVVRGGKGKKTVEVILHIRRVSPEAHKVQAVHR